MLGALRPRSLWRALRLLVACAVLAAAARPAPVVVPVVDTVAYVVEARGSRSTPAEAVVAPARAEAALRSVSLRDGRCEGVSLGVARSERPRPSREIYLLHRALLC